MIKGLLVLLAVFCVLIAVLVWAKSRPAPHSAMIDRPWAIEMHAQALNSTGA